MTLVRKTTQSQIRTGRATAPAQILQIAKRVAR
jgi:hypothetical protein